MRGKVAFLALGIMAVVSTGCASRCVVTGNSVEASSARSNPDLTAEFDGREYLFCSSGCKRAFESDPLKYARKRRAAGHAHGGHAGHRH